MNKTWLLSILSITFILLTILQIHERQAITPFFRAEKTIKLKHFQKAKTQLSLKDQDFLELWESMLTGRSAPLSQWMKERYKRLGLNHLFTPSGFHISAVIFPFMKFIKKSSHQLIFLLAVGVGVFFLPGMGALKRMMLIKTHQKVLGTHMGFISALLIDILFGSFQSGALSFTYSFLFVGIIYSGLKGVGLIVWFFLAQILLSYFQGSDISLLLLIFSPLLNFVFSLAMPVLFLFSYPLWTWQLTIGISLLKGIQYLVDQSATLMQFFPSFEVNLAILVMALCLLYRLKRSFLILLFILSFSLNLDRQRNPSLPTNEFVPQGRILKTIYQEKEVKVYLSDGSCRMRLVRGFWWENCSPKRRSRNKLLMKLSYPSSSSRKSSLRG